MSVIESHRSPLTRQVQEGVELELNGAEVLMNSKSEWNNSKLPRIVIESGERLEEDAENGISRCTVRDIKRIKVRGGGKRPVDEREEEGTGSNLKRIRLTEEVRTEEREDEEDRYEYRPLAKRGKSRKGGAILERWIESYQSKRQESPNGIEKGLPGKSWGF